MFPYVRQFQQRSRPAGQNQIAIADFDQFFQPLIQILSGQFRADIRIGFAASESLAGHAKYLCTCLGRTLCRGQHRAAIPAVGYIKSRRGQCSAGFHGQLKHRIAFDGLAGAEYRNDRFGAQAHRRPAIILV